MKRKYGLLIILMAALLLLPGRMATAADELCIGGLFPLSGPAALYGGWCLKGVQIAVDLINDRGGLFGKKLKLVKGDATDPKAAVTEVTRLITYEKVPLVIGTQSSPRAVPASEVANRYKKVYWEVGAEAERFTSRNLAYVFRPFCCSTDKVKPLVDYIKKVVAPALKKDPAKVRIGLWFEHGDWGTDTGNAFMEYAKNNGLKIVMALSHDPASLDLSSDIMRMQSAKLDFIFTPTTLEALGVFVRQLKELGVYFPGGMSGSGTVEGLHKVVKSKDVDYYLDSEGPSTINPNFLDKKQRKNLNELKHRWKAKYKENVPYIGYLGFGNAMILLENVLPRAGSLNPEAVRKAAVKTDIPEGGTTLGYGVKFFPPGNPQQGQNSRSWAVLTQYQNMKNVTVWPKKVQVSAPWCPVPSWKDRAK